jgi:hypothetical protein
MKVTKTNVFRLTIEKACGCQATREYEDGRYTKPLVDGKFTPCDKHGRGAIAEFAGEMLVEALDKEAETAGKQHFSPMREIEEGDTGGVSASGESVQRLGVSNLPKRNTDGSPLQRRAKRDPLSITSVSIDRSDQKLPQHSPVDTGALQVASIDTGDGITMTGDIDTVPEDPRLTGIMADELGGLEDALDEFDMKDAGVPRSVLNQAKD